MKKQMMGIAFLLFVILLCCGEVGLNQIFRLSFSDFPFSLVGLLIGCIGLFFAVKGAQER